MQVASVLKYSVGKSHIFKIYDDKRNWQTQTGGKSVNDTHGNMYDIKEIVQITNRCVNSLNFPFMTK